ncbi:unnamed protein product [Cuscuta campestris]|uniref:Uncharacterized protein n=1 Tax=Cuscuta campestris TaxID=132261 RepID=A0A484KAK4_9ASTE|nr:unnamed protein product [Cuscuta campestris]
MQQTAAEVIVAVGKSPRISGTPISETNPKLQFEVVHESPSFLAEISRLEMEFFTVKRNLETNSQDLSMPSFSLGLTPEEKENQNEEIQHEEVQHEEIQTKNGDGTAKHAISLHWQMMYIVTPKLSLSQLFQRGQFKGNKKKLFFFSQPHHILTLQGKKLHPVLALFEVLYSLKDDFSPKGIKNLHAPYVLLFG